MQNFYAVEFKVHNNSDSDYPLSSKNSKIQGGEGYMHDLVCEVVADWGGGGSMSMQEALAFRRSDFTQSINLCVSILKYNIRYTSTLCN